MDRTIFHRDRIKNVNLSKKTADIIYIGIVFTPFMLCDASFERNDNWQDTHFVLQNAGTLLYEVKKK
jgi:hypothetical protein